MSLAVKLHMKSNWCIMCPQIKYLKTCRWSVSNALCCLATEVITKNTSQDQLNRVLLGECSPGSGYHGDN